MNETTPLTLDHEQFLELTDQGRAYYNDLRRNRSYNHYDALRAARYSYGRRKS